MKTVQVKDKISTGFSARLNFKQTRNHSPHLIGGTLVLLLCLLASSITAQTNKDMTGVWMTPSPVIYVVEHTVQHPHGKEVEHDFLEILERSATMKWTLTQRPDGLIVGTNDWIAYDEKGTKQMEGREGLLGFVDGKAGLLSEAADDKKESAQINFKFKRIGKNKIQGFGYSTSSNKLIALRFELIRSHNK